MSEVHISSLVVYCSPKAMNSVRAFIQQINGCEIYAESDEGKFVVVMETDNQRYLTQTIDRINEITGVLNTALVYHQIESNAETLDSNIHATVTTDASIS